jgi:diguanylate cyclase (GGDEF)-like protein
MIDIDHFKRVNDTYGHPTGDDVIREVAARLSGSLRTENVVGRYGGEEFAVLLALTDQDVTACLERLRRAVGDVPVPTRSGPLTVTVSIGAALLRPADGDVSALLARADAALYEAKTSGRDRVRVAPAS